MKSTTRKIGGVLAAAVVGIGLFAATPSSTSAQAEAGKATTSKTSTLKGVPAKATKRDTSWGY